MSLHTAPPAFSKWKAYTKELQGRFVYAILVILQRLLLCLLCKAGAKQNRVKMLKRTQRNRTPETVTNREKKKRQDKSMHALCISITLSWLACNWIGGSTIWCPEKLAGCAVQSWPLSAALHTIKFTHWNDSLCSPVHARVTDSCN